MKAGEAVEGSTIIEQGVQPGERVVTDGQLRLLPGSPVVIRQAAPEASPAAAGAGAK